MSKAVTGHPESDEALSAGTLIWRSATRDKYVEFQDATHTEEAPESQAPSKTQSRYPAPGPSFRPADRYESSHPDPGQRQRARRTTPTGRY